MKVLTIVSVGLLLLGIFSCSVQSEEATPETTVSNPTTTEPTTTSGSPPTTTEPPTTSSSNFTTTEPSTTPSGSPATEPPTTHTTTTPAAPTTTQSPTTTPKPHPVTGKWDVHTDGGKMCILLDLAATFNITYNSTSGTSPKFAQVTVPINATGTGSCNGSEYILLQFNNTEGVADFSLKITFSKDSSSYSVANMTSSFTYDDATFINPKDLGQKVSLTAAVPDFMTSINSANSITCADNREIKFSGQDGDATLHIDDIKVQAYMDTTARTYGEGKNCVPKKTSKVVPIAVGCALAALVVIVLIAYLIGRRRSRQQGYQSV